jgi:TonB family protein
MNSFVCGVASYVVNAVWEVASIGGAGWVVSRLVKRTGPRTEHVVWVATLMLAIATPALPLWRWLLNAVSMSAAGKGQISIVLMAAEGARTDAANVALLSPRLIATLLTIYGIGFLYFAVRLCWSLSSTAKLLREAKPVSLSSEKESVWRRCQRVLSIRNGVVLGSNGIAGPVAVAFLQPVLLLPSRFSVESGEDDFLAAIAHEGAHLQRHDFQKNLFYEIVSLVIAFHPVTWMVKSKIAETREMICDGVATETLIDSQVYTESLLRLAMMVSRGSRASVFHAIGIFDANILEKRIMMMNTKKEQLSAFVKCALLVPASILLVAVAAGAGTLAVGVVPQAASQVGQQNPYGVVYNIGKDVSAPKLISSVSPEFPQSARGSDDKLEGTCLVGFVVDAKGIPQDVHIVRSLRQDFDEKAVGAVRQYRFRPGMKAGTPVAVSLKVEVRFARF